MKPLKPFGAVAALTLLTLASPRAGQCATGGFQVGANVSNFSTQNIGSLAGAPEPDNQSYLGFIGGVQAEFRLNDFLFVEPAILLFQLGTTQQLGAGQSTLVLTYLDFPLLLKTKFLPHRAFRPFLLIGPSAALKMSDSSSNLSGGTNLPTTAFTFRSIDAAAVFGGGAEADFLPGNTVFLEIRYALGLVDINPSDEVVWKTRSIQLVLGMNFSL